MPTPSVQGENFNLVKRVEKVYYIIWSFSARTENFSYRSEFASFSVTDSMSDMSACRRKRRGNVCKANTESDAPGKFFCV